MSPIWEDLPNRLEQNALETIIRMDVSWCLKNNIAFGKWERVLGYTLENLKNHLESLFLPGMYWNNYGLKGWTIDHIIPRSFFLWRKYEDAEFQYCWSLSNLQPLWQNGKNGNASKKNKIYVRQPPYLCF